MDILFCYHPFSLLISHLNLDIHLLKTCISKIEDRSISLGADIKKNLSDILNSKLDHEI